MKITHCFSQEHEATLGSGGGSLDKEKEQAKLELEMQRRRERIERWREEKKKKAVKVSRIFYSNWQLGVLFFLQNYNH